MNLISLLKTHKIISLIVLTIIAILFYRYQLYPMTARSSCSKTAGDEVPNLNLGYSGDRQQYEAEYQRCMRSYGLER
jgi:hypothetical protein